MTFVRLLHSYYDAGFFFWGHMVLAFAASYLLVKSWREPSEEFLSKLKNEAEERLKLNRQPDLAIIDGELSAHLNPGQSWLRVLVNSFMIVGLMGTMMGLFRAWQSLAGQGLSADPQVALGALASALGVSFFGLLWALVTMFASRRVRARHETIHHEFLRELRVRCEAVKKLPEELVLDEHITQFRESGAAIRTALEELVSQSAASFRQLRELNQEVSGAFGSAVSEYQAAVATVSRGWQDLSKGYGETVAAHRSSIEQLAAVTRLAVQQVDTTFGRITEVFEKLSLTANRMNAGLEVLKDLPAQIIPQVQEVLLRHAEVWASQLKSATTEVGESCRNQTEIWGASLAAQSNSLKVLAEWTAQQLQAWQDQQQREFQHWAGEIRQEEEARQRRAEEFVGATRRELESAGARLAETFLRQGETLRVNSDQTVKSILEALHQTYGKWEQLVATSTTTAAATSEQIRLASEQVNFFFADMRRNFDSFRDGTVAFQNTIESFSHREDAHNVLWEMNQAAKAQTERLGVLEETISGGLSNLAHEYARHAAQVIAADEVVRTTLQENAEGVAKALVAMKARMDQEARVADATLGALRDFSLATKKLDELMETATPRRRPPREKREAEAKSTVERLLPTFVALWRAARRGASAIANRMG